MFGLLGNIRIGDDALTGPIAPLGEDRSATLPQHEVARGKPVIQDMGDELDRKTMSFFWDETFCDPEGEAAKLQAAFAARQALAYVGGDGTFRGVSWVIQDFRSEVLKTTASGKVVRIKVTVNLIEAPSSDPLGSLYAAARAAAGGLLPWGSSNPGARR